MPNTHLTRCRLTANDLKDLAVELKRIAQDTQENISEVEAVLAQYYLTNILESLIPATRIGRRTWPSLSRQMQSLTHPQEHLQTPNFPCFVQQNSDSGSNLHLYSPDCR